MRSVNVADMLSGDILKLRTKDWGNVYSTMIQARGNVICAAMTVAAPGAETVYRVLLIGEGASVVCIDMPMDFNSEAICREYGRFEQAPQWLQDRVLALRMLTEKPPTSWVEGLGRRISKDVFWVVK